MMRAGGVFANLSADFLGTVVVRDLLQKHGYIDVDELIFGCVSQPYNKQNIARVIALQSGLDQSVPAYTVHRNCASGMTSVTTAAAKIKAGDIDCAIVGGTESMSNYPLIYRKDTTLLFSKLMRAKTVGQRLKIFSQFRPKHFLKPIVGLKEGLTDPIHGIIMGDTAEILAKKFKISREAQDEFAMNSHWKADGAKAKLAEEICSVAVPTDYQIYNHDDAIRPDQNMQKLGKMRPYFDRKYGTVTIGNSCGITDGACALILASDKKVKEWGIEPLGWIRKSTYAGCDPREMGLGPAYATAKVLKKARVKYDNIGLIELNEAFAAQVIACQRALNSDEFCQREFGLSGAIAKNHDWTHMNVNGGAVALGHPVGMTGARLPLTLLKEMRRRNVDLGLATLCIGGGQGGSMLLEVK
jgi:acetyl-CoA C-acetyltransferase/acetyl-CoA acyltransferase